LLGIASEHLRDQKSCRESQEREKRTLMKVITHRCHARARQIIIIRIRVVCSVKIIIIII
jgi:hypothetical protein